MIHLHLPEKLRFSPGARPATGGARLAGTLALVALCACEDARVDPTGLLAIEDAHPAVTMAAELPSLPGLAGAGRVEPELTGAIDLWVGSWALPADVGEQRRAAAYDQAGPRLAATLPEGAMEEGLARVDAALDVAAWLDRTGLPEAVAERVAEAREEAGAAHAALDAGALPAAVRSTLRAADLLRSVGPEGVARTLIARAEGGLGWAGGPADPVAIGRAERLLAGARSSADQGEYGLAIRRAYYACQLLGVALE